MFCVVRDLLRYKMLSFKCFKFVRRQNLYSPSTGIFKHFSQSAVTVVEQDVKYPAIFDVSTPEAVARHERQKFYDRIKSMPTVEEKLYAISEQFDPKVKIYFMTSVASRYQAVPFQQYVTRTHLIRGLPEKLQETNVEDHLKELRPHLCRAIASQLTGQWKSGTVAVHRILYELVSLMYRLLSTRHDFIQSSAFDHKPRIHAYWWHGDFFSKKDKLNEKNICFQYNGHPEFAVRVRSPLTPIVPLDDSLCSSADVLQYNYLPVTSGLPFRIRKFPTSVPGFWPGDPCEYPFISFFTTELIDEFKAKLDHLESSAMSLTIEDGCGIISSFGWLASTAMNQGFTPFHDVTYPRVAQTVITNGQDWHFFVYQLNTMCFHGDVDLKNKRNICWSSGKMRLFEAVENGELKGVNDEVFKVLLQFFLNTPQVPEGVELKPYLSAPTLSAEEFKDLKNKLLKMNSNRPDRNAHKYEVPLWQRIYKYHPDAPPSPQVRLW